MEGGRRQLFCFALQSRPLAGGGKKLAAVVAGSRARRRLRRRSSVRPDQSRSRWAWSGQRKRRKPRHGCCRLALSVSRADIGFAGFLAGKFLNLNLNVKAVEFPRDRREATTRTAVPTCACLPLMRHRVWRGVDDAGPDDKAMPASLLRQAGRSEFRRFDRLDEGVVETGTGDMALPSAPCRCTVN